MAALWAYLRSVGQTLRPCRFSVISLLLGAVLFAAQAQDLLRAVADHLPHRSPGIGQLLCAVFVWGHTNWYFARVMLYFRFPDTPPFTPRMRTLATWVPRLLGTLPMLVFAIACVRAASPFQGAAVTRLHAMAGVSLAIGVVFLAAIAARRRVSQRMRRRLPRHPEQHAQRLRDLAAGTWVYVGLWAVTGLVLFLLFWFAAPAAAPRFGPLALVFLTACVWVPAGSAAVYAASRSQAPVLGVALAIAAIFSGTTDHHFVRTAPGAPPVARFEDTFRSWLGGLPPARPTVFFVAGEGGGIRAAYWTAKVLAGLEDEAPGFANRLFAISTVSGSSLGATVFDALLAERLDGNLAAARLAEQAKGVLGEDFLSPVLAALLYPDLVFSFIPGSAMVASADRAHALESSWERSWRAHVGTERFSQPFQSLWSRPVPHLLLNTTCAETGRRYVVSSLAVAPRLGDVSDALAVIGSDVPLSTAAHLSARFPYVSPGGRTDAHLDRCQHFVDGGYFENSGTATLLDLMQAVPDEVTQGGRTISYLPVVISINNDPARAQTPAPISFLADLTIPLRTLFATRGARGRSAEIALAKYVTGELTLEERPSGCTVLGDDEHGYFIEFALSASCPPPNADPSAQADTVPVPLGWMLSGAAQAQMDCQWETEPCQAARGKIAALLARP